MINGARFAALALAALVAVGPAAAQEQQEPPQQTERVGSILAVVGDSVITNWDLAERMQQWSAASSQPVPVDTSSTDFLDLRCRLVDLMSEELLVLQAAVRDTTLVPDDAAIERSVDDRINQIRASLGGPAAFRQALNAQGLTEQELRDMNIALAKRTALQEMYVAKVRRGRSPPPIPERDIREFFDQVADSIGMRPATVSFDQVLVPVQPSDEEIQRARTFADSLYNLIQEGAPFDSLAREYSQDPSAANGGAMDWIRRGQTVKEFEDAVFSPFMGVGSVTPPVRTDFGIHLIKLDRIRGAERFVRHILIRTEITDQDIERAREAALSIKARLEAGERPTDLARSLGTDEEYPSRVGPIARDSLPAPYALLSNADQARIRDAAQLDVLDPMLLELSQGAILRFLVIRITETEDSRPGTYEDYREQIRDRLANQRLAEEIIDELRRRTRVELRFNTGGGCQ